MHKDQLEGLQQIFGQYLQAAVPAGDAPLAGDEAAKITAFKDALGLSDEEAAPVFIDVGRRLSRARFEVDDRQGQFEQRKAFQRLIYVSYAVLGDQKAAFLLPWRREFGLNDSQLFVARRDNARDVFAARLKAEHGGELPADREALRALRAAQLEARLMDDAAAEVVREAARARVERAASDALAALRAPLKSRDPAKVASELRAALDYGAALERLAAESAAAAAAAASAGAAEGAAEGAEGAAAAADGQLVPGVGAPSLRGGSWDQPGGARRRDARELYKAFAEEGANRLDAITPALDADLKALAAMLALPPKDAADARAEVAAALYRRLLKDAVAGGRLDSAASPAQALGELVDRSGFSPEAAMEMHKQLYRGKIGAVRGGTGGLR